LEAETRQPPALMRLGKENYRFAWYAAVSFPLETAVRFLKRVHLPIARRLFLSHSALYDPMTSSAFICRSTKTKAEKCCMNLDPTSASSDPSGLKPSATVSGQRL
jgi:hypothetical protein